MPPFEKILAQYFIKAAIFSFFILLSGIFTHVYGTEKKLSIKISGKVTDRRSGDPLPFTNVLIKGSNKGTVTDNNGMFNITFNANDGTLIFSHIGYHTTTAVISSDTILNIALNKKNDTSDEVIVVGYNTQARTAVSGSIVTLKNKDLSVAPITSTINTLVGRVPGLTAIQPSGMPGADNATISVRGFEEPLLIVDGVQMSFNNIDVDQIETVTVLKDAAASIYGARGGNGIILITTKRGADQKPVISVNSSATFQSVTKILKPANSGQLATMRLEQYLQSGQSGNPPFTQDDIDKYFAGNDPTHPNTNWYNHTFRNFAPQTNNNISVNGGNKKLSFFGFLGYTDQATMIKTNGGQYERYNARSNIDAAITDDLELSFDLSAIFETRVFPVRGLQNTGFLWEDYYSTEPWYPADLPDPTKISYGGITTGSIAAVSNTGITGYTKTDGQLIRGAITLTYDIKKIRGLKAKAFLNYNTYSTYNKKFGKPYSFYTYDPNTQLYTKAGSFTQSDLREVLDRSHDITQQYGLSYDKAFKYHRLSTQVLIESIDIGSNYFQASRINLLTPLIDQLFVGSTTGQNATGSASEAARFSYVGRATYNYKEKYLLDIILRADASARFSPTNRWGYFPGVSAGWVISKEKFIDKITWLDNLKLRVSYGRSGNDLPGNFQYLSNYTTGGNVILNGINSSTLYITNLANPLLTWEEMAIYNAGIDFDVNDHILFGSFDIFKRERTGIPGNRANSLPSTFGATLPAENINSLTDRGFELVIGTVKTFKKFSYNISGNISWSRAKWDHYEEPVYTDADEKNINGKSGQWVDRKIGYISAGLFTSREQIDALPYTYADLNSNAKLNPGDVIYKDLNGDSVLNWRDQKEIGQGTMPHWMYGLSTQLKYKNFDLNFLFQGAFGYTTFVNLTQFSNEQTYLLRWNKETNDPNALVPRLGGAPTNNYISDLNYKDVSYIRLKAMAIGYELPEKFLKKLNIKKARFYFAGTNLLTVSSVDEYGVDPEIPSGLINVYPQQRTLSVGLNLSF